MKSADNDSVSQRIALPNGGHGWLSRFDLSRTIIEHIASEEVQSTLKPGMYYPSSSSPAFTRLDETAVLKTYRTTHGDRAQALINCSFFERYDPVTELSFPIKRAGTIITGGSSPYGPCANPTDARYKDVTLKALVWNERAIVAADYDHKTGGILNEVAFSDGFVTYNYKDHPANILAGDPIDQYQLLGTVKARDGDLSKALLVLTIINGRMVDGAALLKRHGVEGTVLTIDGGPSTHLWTRRNETIIATKSKILPHFLGFRART